MNFATCILIAFVFTFATALPQDVSELQHKSSESELPIDDRGLSEILDIVKKACEMKEACAEACKLIKDACIFCKVCDVIDML